MLQPFKAFITEYKLLSSADKTLLAVSGGMDSIAMTELFQKSRFRFGIAHCNFSLRGKESDLDEELVGRLAQKYRVPFFHRKFDTSGTAKKLGISVQMAARELRYSWFEEIRNQEGFDLIATAHHLDDQAETFMINLLRGTGIAGLHGILPIQGLVIRPMLFCGRREIEGFVRTTGLEYREDQSNDEAKYLRNRIRHELLPLMATIQPGFFDSITGTIGKIRDAEQVYRTWIDDVRSHLIRKEGNRYRIILESLKKYTQFRCLPWELLSPFGFNEETINDIINHLDRPSGKIFMSPEYRLVKDRDSLLLDPKPGKPESEQILTIDKSEGKWFLGEAQSIVLKKIARTREFVIPADEHIAYLDLSKIRFPLTCRRWKPGDYFYPLGLNRKKKISDFLIGLKISRPEKEKVHLLLSRNEVALVIGYRISHRFRITSRTTNILIVEQLHHDVYI